MDSLNKAEVDPPSTVYVPDTTVPPLDNVIVAVPLLPIQEAAVVVAVPVIAEAVETLIGISVDVHDVPVV